MINKDTMDPVLCCIALREHEYIDEFITHHLSIGFNKIYVYDNGDTQTIFDRPNVQVIHFPGTFPWLQVTAYNHFIQHHGRQHTHVMFLDVDEFLTMKKHTNIKFLLQEYMGDKGGALAFNWVFYGSNGHTVQDNIKGVMERFTRRQRGVDPHVKYICRIEDVTHVDSPHYPRFRSPQYTMYDTNGKNITGALNHAGDDNVAQINHYFVKTPEEYKKKMERPRCDTGVPRPIEEIERLWREHDRNEIEDDTTRKRARIL